MISLWASVNRNTPALTTSSAEFVDKVSDYQLLSKGSVLTQTFLLTAIL